MRKKLIELMITAKDLVTLSRQADFLIANGVTIPVRCKDCKKRYNPKECPMCVFVYGEQHDVTRDYGYCDRGERKTE